MQRADDLYARIDQPDISASDLNRVAKTGDASKVPYVRWALRVDGIERDSNWISEQRAAGDKDIWNRVEGAHVWNHRPDKTFSPWRLFNT